MRVSDLDIPPELKKSLEDQGFSELFPPQAEAIPIALRGRSVVAAVPTASGKSLIGFIPALDAVLSRGRKVLYIVPLKALASEKKSDLDRFAPLGVSVAMSTGDLDSDGGRLAGADIIVATSEKADSMIRHGSGWIREVGVVIADEVHMIHDPDRGPTLEVTLAKMMARDPGLQVIALSATVSNAGDLAEWLGAELVTSDWRPIPLKEGVYFEGEIDFDDNTSASVPGGKDPVWDLAEQTVSSGGQCLVFVSTRRSAESLAARYAPKMGRISGASVPQGDLDMLEGGSESTPLGKKLSSCVKCGIAFHNAGLTYAQRKYVEDGFKDGRIKCIVATPTLAAGINLPARRVIVRDTSRFESNAGNVPISVMEVKQMCGRAGRPGYDPYGEAVLIGKSPADRDRLMESYVMHDTESLTSKLGSEKVLRSHILGLVATGDADSEDSVTDFIRGTFYGSTSRLYGIEGAVESCVEFLERHEMVERDGDRIAALPFGRRVSDLYIDPVSAVALREAVENMGGGTGDLPILHAVASVPDVLGLYPRKGDMERLSRMAGEIEGSLLVGGGDGPYEEDLFMSSMKVAAVLHDWINEVSEEEITEGMGIGPGDVRSRVEMAEWIMYSMGEIAHIFNPDAAVRIKPLLTRLRYGVREELLSLVSFKGVGRARARILFDRGIRSRGDALRAGAAGMSPIPGIGPALAASIAEQAGGGGPGKRAAPAEKAASRGARQTDLSDF